MTAPATVTLVSGTPIGPWTEDQLREQFDLTPAEAVSFVADAKGVEDLFNGLRLLGAEEIARRKERLHNPEAAPEEAPHDDRGNAAPGRAFERDVPGEQPPAGTSATAGEPGVGTFEPAAPSRGEPDAASEGPGPGGAHEDPAGAGASGSGEPDGQPLAQEDVSDRPDGVQEALPRSEDPTPDRLVSGGGGGDDAADAAATGG